LSSRNFLTYLFTFVFLLMIYRYPAFAVAAQVNQHFEEHVPQLATQADGYYKKESWMEINTGHFKGSIIDFGNSFTIPNNRNTVFDPITGYIGEKQSLVPESSPAKNSWGIAPLFDRDSNSPLTANMRFGIIIKLHF
jgi:hypothetical protein